MTRSTVMTDDSLFDASIYGDPKPRETKKATTPKLVSRPPGYHLVTNRRGVQGFHRTKVPEAAMARDGACVTYCGIVGRRLGEYPAIVPLCEECETENLKKR